MQFSSAHHALRWAYETSTRPIVKTSSVNKMRGDERGTGDNLSQHDLHGQAALIFSLCSRVLSTVHMAYINVQYGRNAAGLNPLMRQLAAAFGTGVHRCQGIEAIIRVYCGERGGMRDIRRAFGCGLLRATSYRNLGYDALDTIHAQAMGTLEEEMRAAGLIGEGPVPPARAAR